MGEVCLEGRGPIAQHELDLVGHGLTHVLEDVWAQYFLGQHYNPSTFRKRRVSLYTSKASSAKVPSSNRNKRSISVSTSTSSTESREGLFSLGGSS